MFAGWAHHCCADLADPCWRVPVGAQMWLKPLQKAEGWTNILHKGANNDQRAPAIFVLSNST